MLLPSEPQRSAKHHPRQHCPALPGKAQYWNSKGELCCDQYITCHCIQPACNSHTGSTNLVRNFTFPRTSTTLPSGCKHSPRQQQQSWGVPGGTETCRTFTGIFRMHMQWGMQQLWGHCLHRAFHTRQDPPNTSQPPHEFIYYRPGASSRLQTA